MMSLGTPNKAAYTPALRDQVYGVLRRDLAAFAPAVGVAVDEAADVTSDEAFQNLVAALRQRGDAVLKEMDETEGSVGDGEEKEGAAEEEEARAEAEAAKDKEEEAAEAEAAAGEGAAQ